MSEYLFYCIRPSDFRSLEKMDRLLHNEGIERDRNLEYSIGLFDDDYNIIATGSCFMNTLRCLAVDSNHRGEGLMNELLSYLCEYEMSMKRKELYIYTKCDTAKFFADLGFYEILRVNDRVVFMENKPHGFADYIERLKNETERSRQNSIKALFASSHPDTPYKAMYPDKRRAAAIVMNANPFSMGHLYLIERACAENEVLHLFIVSEDVSTVPFKVRYELVKRGTRHLNNIIYHETGDYIISTATFPSYFLKEEEKIIEAQARLDIKVFMKIAETLGIDRRYAGEEPLSVVTAIYNKVMADEFSHTDIEYIELARRTTEDGSIISASQVRAYIRDGKYEKLKELVPEAVYDYFTSSEAEAIIKKLQSIKEIRHY